MSSKPNAESVFPQLERLLPHVQKPVQYVGGELNAVTKPWDSVDVHWCLSYPDAYEVGIPNQGVQILYEVINEIPDAIAERTYAVWPDLEALMREHRVPLTEARPRVFCDLRLALSSPDRHDAVDALRGNRHAAMPWRRLSQGALWRRYAASPFVLSAVGNGIDCHRTYEALYLGCIVITKRSSIAPLFEGLPVAFVESWAEAGDPANLRRWTAELGPLTARDNVDRRLDPRRCIAALEAELPRPTAGYLTPRTDAP